MRIFQCFSLSKFQLYHTALSNQFASQRWSSSAMKVWDLGARLLEILTLVHSPPSCALWGKSVHFLSLRFLSCKMGLLRVLSPRVSVRIKMYDAWKALHTEPGTSWALNQWFAIGVLWLALALSTMALKIPQISNSTLPFSIWRNPGTQLDASSPVMAS